MSTLGQRMKSRRKELKLTQADLAAMLGYKDKSTIAKIESGTNDITQSRAWEIANALQMPISYLMGWTDEKPPKPITEADRALLEAFHAAPGGGLRCRLFLNLCGSEESGGLHKHLTLVNVLCFLAVRLRDGFGFGGAVLPNSDLRNGFLALLDAVAEALPVCEGVERFGFLDGGFLPVRKHRFVGAPGVTDDSLLRKFLPCVKKDFCVCHCHSPFGGGCQLLVTLCIVLPDYLNVNRFKQNILDFWQKNKPGKIPG